MDEKTSKFFVLLTALLVLSFLLASCQSVVASTEEMNRKRAMDAWEANLTAQGERYLEEMRLADGSLPGVSSDAQGDILFTQDESYLIEMIKFRALDACGC